MTQEHFICVTCGTQFAATDAPPPECPICEDDRQYIGPNGQQWTTLAQLRKDHQNAFRELDTNLTGIITEPKFAIGPQAHLIQTPNGNVLWDCITYLDDATVAEIQQRGGLAAIAISHPHFFSCMVEWSRAFGDIPIFLHADHKPWVMRPDDAVVYWPGETYQILPGLTAIRCGGHFPGSTVLHWAEGAGGKGALFTGDTIYVVADRRWVTFMYSYPNDIPLNEAAVRRIVTAVEPYDFDRLHSAFAGGVVEADARNAVRRSADRYIEHIRPTT
jgi:glyoxylase-like metal-dependent hydrolase (beta-lactamase superfamily II)